MNALEFHPLANLFPLIEGKDFDDFCAGIKADGHLHDKIVLLDGKILDGRNRYRGCIATGVTPHFETFNATIHGDPLTYVISKNLHRRHLTESQRAMLAAELATMKQGERTDVEPSANLQKVSQADAAKLTNVSTRSVASATKVKNEGTPELRDAVKQGHVPVSVAEKAVALSPEKQREIVSRARAGDISGANGEIKKAARTIREAELGAKQAALPAKKYGVILADPEWRFEPYSRETGMDRAADNHYPTSETDVIKSRPVGDIAADDCVLLLWATVPMLPDALAVMAAWGFAYKSHVVWLKDQIGTGYWFRNQHELLLIGTRGNVPAPAPGTQFRSALAFDVAAHSEKPPFAHEIAEAYFPSLQKIELNARRRREGWDAWGLEAPDYVADAGKMVPPHDPETGEIIESGDAGALAKAREETAGSLADLPSASPEPINTESEGTADADVQANGTDARNAGGDHVTDHADQPPHEAAGAGERVPPDASVPARFDPDDDLDIPPALRRVTLTADELAALEAIDIDALTLNERTLVLKLRGSNSSASALDRTYLAKILAKRRGAAKPRPGDEDDPGRAAA
jgi:N6-adenosine-specific RNA methylase IME4